MHTIREQIEPHLRKAGIKPTAEATGVHRVSLQRWLAGAQTISDQQVEAVCRHLGLAIRVTRTR